jgi:protocatechuate 3,4-dioxygenase beta subunit
VKAERRFVAKRLLSVALLGVGAIVALVFALRGSKELRPEPAEGHVSAQAAEEKPALPNDSERASNPDPPATPPARSLPAASTPLEGVVNVRVITEREGAPVAGVAVSLAAESATGQRKVDGRTDADGAWIVSMEAPATVVIVTAEAGATTSWAAWEGSQALEAGASIAISVKVPAGRSIVGVVVDDANATVSGATIDCWLNTTVVPAEKGPSRTAVSDERGEFRLDGVAGLFVLRADASKRACRYTVCGRMPTDRDVTGLVLRLATARVVRGKVASVSGTPVNKAAVRVTTPLINPSTSTWAHEACDGILTGNLFATLVTADDGTFAQKLPADVELTCRVTHPNYASKTVRVAAGIEDVVVVLDDGVHCAGTVRNERGELVEGATVHLFALEERRCTTDARGRFVLTGLTPLPSPGSNSRARCVLSVTKPGHAPTLVELSTIDDRAPDLDVTLEAGMTIAGIVVDATRKAVAGARVRIAGDRRLENDPAAQSSQSHRTWEEYLGCDAATTSAEGTFRFGDLHPGVFTLAVRAGEANEPKAIVITRAGNESLEIVLGDGLASVVTLRGRVLDASSGATIDSFDVQVQPSVEEKPMRYTNPLGRFEIGGLRSGDLRIVVRAATSAMWGYAALRDVPPGVLELDFLLAPSRTLRLQVLDGSGQPCRDCWVEVHDTPDRDLGHFEQRGILAQGGVDDSGRVDLANLPASPITVAVAKGPGRPTGPGRKFRFDLTAPVEGVRVLKLGDDRR